MLASSCILFNHAKYPKIIVLYGFLGNLLWQGCGKLFKITKIIPHFMNPVPNAQESWTEIIIKKAWE